MERHEESVLCPQSMLNFILEMHNLSKTNSYLHLVLLAYN